MKSTVRFDILNSVVLHNTTNTKTNIVLKNDVKVKNIKKIFFEKFKFLTNDYKIVFCKNQTVLYNIIITAVVDSYINIIGVPHIICGTMEHPSILKLLEKLSKSKKITISYINTDIYGTVSVADLTQLVQPNTAIIIVSYINYLIGTINNITDIQKFAISKKIPLFTDSIYAFGKVNILPELDIFSIDFEMENLCLLILKKSIVDGYKLNYHSDAMSDTADKLIKITDSDYKKVMQQIIGFSVELPSNNNQYLIDALINARVGRVYYYHAAIKTKLAPEPKDIIILGIDSKLAKTNIISIVFCGLNASMLNFLKKNNISVVQAGKPFENIGLLPKWAKKVITLNLQNATKKNIDLFVKSLK